MFGVAVAVDERQEAGGHVPVETEVHVLQGVHGKVLEAGEVDYRGEEVEADEVGADGAAFVGRDGADHVVHEGVEAAALVEPEDKDFEHVWCFGGEP